MLIPPIEWSGNYPNNNKKSLPVGRDSGLVGELTPPFISW
jgi:hypothetical protein